VGLLALAAARLWRNEPAAKPEGPVPEEPAQAVSGY
jgi:hypothetical protein